MWNIPHITKAVLRSSAIFQLKGQEVAGRWRKILNEEPHYFYSSSWIIKWQRRINWVLQMVNTAENYTQKTWGKGGYLEDVGIDEKITWYWTSSSVRGTVTGQWRNYKFVRDSTQWLLHHDDHSQSTSPFAFQIHFLQLSSSSLYHLPFIPSK